jgi:phosphoribosylamine--glycine ligase
MRVLVVGGGAREHALIWRMAENPTIDKLFAAPGNAGMAKDAECVRVAVDDVPGIADLVERQRIDLTVVGPEIPLVAGLADELLARGRLVFGPTKDAARLEGSKSWAKSLCERYGIPAARSRTATTMEGAVEAFDEFEAPYVMKADGLAAGKGVAIVADRDEATVWLRAALEQRTFGAAGASVVIEEFLSGTEVSAFALSDGRDVLPLTFAQDFKRVGDGDAGPNTGGMGAYSPVPFVDDATADEIRNDVLVRTVRAMESEGARYAGVLYAGLMLTDEGPKVLEFNARFGDPETQVIVPRLGSDLAELCLACAEGNLALYKTNLSPQSCVTVVLASGGYPDTYETGFEIEGLAEAKSVEGALIFHAGTAERGGRVVTAGGRVLSVGALGDDVAEARARAYEAVSRISFDGMRFRSDIAANAAEGGSA